MKWWDGFVILQINNKSEETEMGNKEKVHELVCVYISEAEDNTVAGVEVQD